MMDSLYSTKHPLCFLSSQIVSGHLQFLCHALFVANPRKELISRMCSFPACRYAAEHSVESIKCQWSLCFRARPPEVTWKPSLWSSLWVFTIRRCIWTDDERLVTRRVIHWWTTMRFHTFVLLSTWSWHIFESNELSNSSHGKQQK